MEDECVSQWKDKLRGGVELELSSLEQWVTHLFERTSSVVPNGAESPTGKRKSCQPSDSPVQYGSLMTSPPPKVTRTHAFRRNQRAQEEGSVDTQRTPAQNKDSS
ncbi:unnamed protein product [Arctogadus glacialis]